jgi:hypothetical protein
LIISEEPALSQAEGTNWIIKYSIRNGADDTTELRYKRNHVVFEATDAEAEELKRELLITGLAVDVKIRQQEDNTEEPDRNGINCSP